MYEMPKSAMSSFYAFFYTASRTLSSFEGQEESGRVVVGNVALVSPVYPTFCVVLKLFEVAE